MMDQGVIQVRQHQMIAFESWINSDLYNTYSTIIKIAASSKWHHFKEASYG